MSISGPSHPSQLWQRDGSSSCTCTPRPKAEHERGGTPRHVTPRAVHAATRPLSSRSPSAAWSKALYSRLSSSSVALPASVAKGELDPLPSAASSPPPSLGCKPPPRPSSSHAGSAPSSALRDTSSWRSDANASAPPVPEEEPGSVPESPLPRSERCCSHGSAASASGRVPASPAPSSCSDTTTQPSATCRGLSAAQPPPAAGRAATTARSARLSSGSPLSSSAHCHVSRGPVESCSRGAARGQQPTPAHDCAQGSPSSQPSGLAQPPSCPPVAA